MRTHIAVLLVFLAAVAQGVSPVRFSGSAGVYGEYGWISGDPLAEPRPELRFSLNPSVSFWGFPLALDMNLSTLESSLRQQLNKYRFFLHPKEWAEGMTNLSGFALAIKGIELGSCNPSWTPLTLSGAPVLGGAFELNPWYVYLAGAAGRTQRAVAVSDSTRGAYARMLYSAKFGFGKKEGTHFFVTGIFVTDDSSSLADNRLPMPGDTVVPPDSFEAVKPQENYVLGAEFNLDLFEGAFRLESEVAGCELTRDNRMPVERWDWLPEWVANTFKPRMSSSVDYAYSVRPSLNVLDTRLSGKLEFVGPGYVSLGAPSLRNDNLRVGGSVSRDFFDRSVSLSVGFSTERDNLFSVRDSAGNELCLKSRTTRFTSWDASLGLSFPNLPYLQLGYYPYFQRDESTGTAGRALSASVGHSFQTGFLAHSAGVSFSYNDRRGDGPDADNTSWDLGLNHGIGFEFPLSVSAGAGYARSVSAAASPDSRLYCDLTPSYTLFERWNNSLSLGGSFGTATRVDVRYSSSFPVWKICDARVGVSDAVYRGEDGRYSELRLTVGLARHW